MQKMYMAFFDKKRANELAPLEKSAPETAPGGGGGGGLGGEDFYEHKNAQFKRSLENSLLRAIIEERERLDAREAQNKSVFVTLFQIWCIERQDGLIWRLTKTQTQIEFRKLLPLITGCPSASIHRITLEGPRACMATSNNSLLDCPVQSKEQRRWEKLLKSPNRHWTI